MRNTTIQSLTNVAKKLTFCGLAIVLGVTLMLSSGLTPTGQALADVETWVPLTPGEETGIKFGTESPYAIAYGPGKGFVVGGTSGRASFSADGVNWTALPAGNDTGVKFGTGTSVINIVYGNGMFIATNSGNTASYSTDGINWTRYPSGDDAGLKFGNSIINAIVYAQDMFVAVGDSGKASYSTDGINWTALTPGTDSGIRFGSTSAYDIAYGNGTFVVVGSSGKASYSTDGINWTYLTPGTDSGVKFNTTAVFAAEYGGDKFVVGGGSGKASYSTDGINWTYLTPGADSGIRFATGEVRGIQYAESKFVAVGTSGRATYSMDGTEWTALPVASTETGLRFGNVMVREVVYGEGKFVAIADQGRASYTADLVLVEFDGGDGSAEDPFQISDCEQLQGMQYNLSAHYLIVADIDCSATNPASDNFDEEGTWADGKGFIPVGSRDEPFTGSLSGDQEHTITGLYINRADDDWGDDGSDESHVGIIGHLDNGSVNNVHTTNSKIKGYQYVGGIVGYANESSITESSFNVGVEDNDCNPGYCVWARYGYEGGGIVGATVNSTVSNVETGGPVKGSGNTIGGIVGSATGSTIEQATSNTFVDGGWQIGGIAGNLQESTIQNSSFDGTLLLVTDDGYKTGSDGGGIAGYIQGSIINNVQVSVTIDADSSEAGYGYSIGGAFGYMTDTEVTAVDVVGSIDADANEVGGFVGVANESDISDASATVSVHVYTEKYEIGGFAGESACGTIISDSAAHGDVIAPSSSSVGGFAGDDSCEGRSSDFINVEAHGDVTGRSQVGGLVGSMHMTDVQNAVATGTVTGTDDEIGGLVGESFVSRITNSHATGDVVGVVDPTEDTAYEASDEVGGLLGYGQGTEIVNSSATGSVSGNSEVGGLVGYAVAYDWDWDFDEETSVSGISPMNISDTFATGNVTGVDEIGGLVGDANGAEITRSYATGMVQGVESTYYELDWNGEEYTVTYSEPEQPESIGGLAGESDDAWVEYYDIEQDTYLDVYLPTSIVESFATGSVSGNAAVGGLVGEHRNSSELVNSFARGSVTGTGENQEALGGAVGEVNGAYIENIYSTGHVSGEGEDVGGLVGEFSDYSVENSFWDTQTSLRTSSGAGDGKTTNQMKAASTFTGAGWDFENTWFIDSLANNGYPCLQWAESVCDEVDIAPPGAADSDQDGIPDATENAGPNNGDANNDGVPDSQQPNVASFVNPTNNQYTVVAIDESCVVTSASIITEASANVPDSGYDYSTGLVSFTADCGQPGYQATATIMQYGVSKQGLALRKHNPNTGSYFTVDAASISDASIGGAYVTTATCTIADGGELDIDNEANGIIVDPVGLASQAVGAPNTGLGGAKR
jgi:hypothetical protein